MSDAEWLRGIVSSGWNNDLFSPDVKAMFERVADKLDAVPPPLAWSTEPPTRTGWYWVGIDDGSDELNIVYYFEGDKWDSACECWAGPIPKPVEPPS